MSSAYFTVTEHVLPSQHIRQYARATVTTQEEVLHICIKQYTPLSNKNPRPGDVTIIAAHANGVGKELYEPFWDELLRYTRTTGGVRIRGIWMADVSFQGASGVLNEGKLGNDREKPPYLHTLPTHSQHTASWSDHARDLLHMTNHFRAHMPRPLIGIGHSMGGQNITDLALLHPRLLSALVLIDPVIINSHPSKTGTTGPAYASTFRRDVWPSRAAAAEQFMRNPFYQRWDPRVLDLWVQHGLRDLPTPLYPTLPAPPPSKNTDVAAAATAAALSAAPVPASPTTTQETPVTLTTTKHQEVFTFLRPNYPLSRAAPSTLPNPPRSTHPDLPLPPQSPHHAPFYRPEPIATFARLPHVRPPVLFVFAAESNLSGLDPGTMADKLAATGAGVGGSGGVQAGMVEGVVLGDGAGHFVPFEQPGVCAGRVGDWLDRVRRGWEEQAAREDGEMAVLRDGAGGGGGVVVGEEWEFWMRSTGGGGNKKKVKAKM